MQIRLKGFVGIETLISNTEGVVAPAGEISTLALTYSKDVGIYNSDTYATLTYYSFHCRNELGAKLIVPAVMKGHVFEMANWVNTSQRAGGSPQTRTAFLAALVQQWSGTAINLNCGEMVQVETGLFFPEWVSFQKTNLDASTGITGNLTTLWFSDSAFRNQYDESEITVIPPVDNLEVFFAGKAQVQAALAARDLPTTLEKVEVAKGGKPETIISSENFNWVDIATAQTVKTSWMLLIYGAAGDDLDQIREAIRNYIAANSTRSEAEWKQIFPDIYKNTEFVIFPQWHLWAIPDRQLYQGTHSPVLNLKAGINYLKAAVPSFGATHLETYGAAMPCQYKSLTLLLTPSPDNRINTQQITQVYPDIINVPTSDALWESMAEDTKDFLEGLHQMVITAETMGAYTDVPQGFRRTTRSGVIYVSRKYKEVNYLVAAKSTAPAAP